MEKTATLDKVCLPIGKAKGLPNEHYTCSSVFQEEKDILLFAKWSGLAVSAEIPNIGDVVPIHFQGIPLFLVRTKENKVKVSNIKQEITKKEIDHVSNILKLLVRENITLENLSIKKDRVNKIVATYKKHRPLTENKHKEVIKGVLKGLYKK